MGFGDSSGGGGGSTGAPTPNAIVADITARNALTPFNTQIVYVRDATADPAISAGGATYIYDVSAWVLIGADAGTVQVFEVADITARTALGVVQDGARCCVVDASGDAAIEEGRAWYSYDATGTTWYLAASFEITKTTILTATGVTAQDTAIDVTASGGNVTKSGDNGALLSSAAAFNGMEQIKVFLNGIDQVKGDDVVWVSASTLKFPTYALASSEVIKVIS